MSVPVSAAYIESIEAFCPAHECAHCKRPTQHKGRFDSASHYVGGPGPTNDLYVFEDCTCVECGAKAGRLSVWK